MCGYEGQPERPSASAVEPAGVGRQVSDGFGSTIVSCWLRSFHRGRAFLSGGCAVGEGGGKSNVAFLPAPKTFNVTRPHCYPV